MGRYEYGDVAMVRNKHGVWNRCIYTLFAFPGRTVDGWRPGVADTFYEAGSVPDEDVRLLTIIDPEDKGAVQGLLDALRGGGWIEPQGAQPLGAALGGSASKAVRPSAIGAVVEDHEETFVHIGGGSFVRAYPLDLDTVRYEWSDFSAWVKVLSSAGVQSEPGAL